MTTVEFTVDDGCESGRSMIVSVTDELVYNSKRWITRLVCR